MVGRFSRQAEQWGLVPRVLAAVGLVGACILITYLVPPLRARALYLLPTSAVALSALYLGMGPALAATIAAVPIIHLVLFDPPMSWGNAATIDIMAFAVFLTVSLLTGSLAASYRSRQHAALAERALTVREAQESQARAEQELAARRSLEQRLQLILQASQPLTSAIHVEVVLREVLSVASQLSRADAYAVWRHDTSGPIPRWYIAASEGLSEEYRRAVIDELRQNPTRSALLERPIVVEDVRTFEMVESRREQYAREGVASFLAVPLRINQRTEGTIVFYYRTRHGFDRTDIESAAALGNLAAAAIHNAELFEARDRLRREAEAAERRSSFLAHASTVLAESLDYQQTLTRVAELAVPKLADWCVVDMRRDDGTIERLAVAHIDPARVEWARRLPVPSLDDSRGAGLVIRTGQSQARFDITPQMLAAAARTPEELQRWRDLRVKSFVGVPLIVRGRSVGAVTMSTEAPRQLGPADLALAEELARRAAQAIDHAWLYREAQQANRAKDEFLATLSHELRTPLNAIYGWSRLLSSGTLTTEARRRAVEIIERNARLQTKLIEDLLDVSRIVTGKLHLDVRLVHLPDAIGAALEALQPAIDAKGIIARVDLDADTPPVHGDATRLQQVVWNILSNAIRFTPPGGHVDVRLSYGDGSVELAVRDDGAGIAPELLPHVFDRFRQGDSSTTRAHGGLGLGLSIVQHLVELHGGTVHAASEGAGHGALFTIRLPAASAVSGEPLRPARLMDPASPGTADLLGVRVLLVDDEADAREMLTMALETHGAQVHSAASADEALLAINGWEPSIIVSDIDMPGADGYTLMRRLRMLGGAMAAIPAVALTTFASGRDRQDAQAAGYQAHLSKPVDPAELRTLLARLTRDARPQPVPPGPRA